MSVLLMLDYQDNLQNCPNLRVLYLYENNLMSLHGIESLRLLTHLYIQDNSLTRLDALDTLPHLTKL